MIHVKERRRYMEYKLKIPHSSIILFANVLNFILVCYQTPTYIHNIIQIECVKYLWIFYGILLVPLNNIMDLYNVKWEWWQCPWHNAYTLLTVEGLSWYLDDLPIVSSFHDVLELFINCKESLAFIWQLTLDVGCAEDAL